VNAVNDDLALAHELADLADAISLGRFRAEDLLVETKPDLTPVTEADRAVELTIRDRLATRRPGEAVVGEEFGDEGSAGAAVRWIIDPIDGTKSYVRGIPVFATLIALEREGRVVAGLASAPALGRRRWWAARGEGAFADGRRIRVSKVERLEDAQLAYGGLSGWERAGLLGSFLALAGRCWRTRGFGDFWMHLLVAEGAADLAAELEVSVWDLAAVQVIVEEAGGRFSDLQGAVRIDRGSGVSTNGLLHDEVVAMLSG
jgi:histidinol-phosphatase